MRPNPRKIEVVSEEMAEILRRKSGAERLAIASGLFSFARQLVVSRIRSQHPDWDEESITREAARRLSHGAI